MKHNLLLSRLYNTPLAIEESKLATITSNITIKLLTDEPIPYIESKEDTRLISATKNNSVSEPKVISVFDSLVSKNGAGASGYTSYQAITTEIQSAIAEGYKSILFYLDTPGGEVSGLFGLSSFIASLPNYGISTTSFTDGMMTSAGYEIASAAQRVYATESSLVGSIAVIMTVINQAKADAQAGLTYELLRSKSDKALGSPHEEPNPEATKQRLLMLSTLDTIFNNSVVSHRPILSLDTILSLNGRSILGAEAKDLKLIDNIIPSFNEVLNLVNEDTKSNKSNKVTISSTQQKGKIMTLEEALTENIKLGAELQATKAATSLEIAKAKEAEKTRVLGILEAQDTFKLSTIAAIKNIKSDMTVDQTVSMFEIIKESTQKNNTLDTATGVISTVNKTMFDSSPDDFHTLLGKSLEKLDTTVQLFKGVS